MIMMMVKKSNVNKYYENRKRQNDCVNIKIWKIIRIIIHNNNNSNGNNSDNINDDGNDIGNNINSHNIDDNNANIIISRSNNDN